MMQMQMNFTALYNISTNTPLSLINKLLKLPQDGQTDP